MKRYRVLAVVLCLGCGACSQDIASDDDPWMLGEPTISDADIRADLPSEDMHTSEVDVATSTCGNGLIEDDERCDGNCPQDPSECGSPANDCTLVSVLGDASTCDATCTPTRRTSCTSRDGCCPPECTPETDDDCAVQDACGEHVPFPTIYPPTSVVTSLRLEPVRHISGGFDWNGDSTLSRSNVLKFNCA